MTKKTGNNMFTTINDRIDLFLKTNAAEDVIEAWHEEENQSTFKKLIKNLQKKDENASKKKRAGPKKANSLYICFCISERDSIKEKYPDLDNQQIMKALGSEWSKIKDDEEKIYRFKEMADRDKERFEKEMTDFKQEQPEVAKKQHAKKPKSNYLFFCDERRNGVKSENPDLSPKQVMSKLGEEWQEVKVTDKVKKYDQLAADDKARYAREKVEDGAEVEEKPKKKSSTKKSSNTEEKPAKTKKTSKKKKDEDEDVDVEEEKPAKKTVKKKASAKTEDGSSEAKPKKLNGYMKFLGAHRESFKTENPTLDSKLVTKELALQWGKLTDDEKQTWKES